MEQSWGAFGSPRTELDVGPYRQGVGALYPSAGAGSDQRGRHAIGGRNAQPGGRRGRGNHGRGGRGRTKFGFHSQCWPLQEAVAAAPAPANPRLVLPCPAPRTSAPTPAPAPTPTPPTLLPPAAPAAAISSNKAAAAALRAQKHKHPTNVPSSAAAVEVEAYHHVNAQPPNPAPAANINPLSPATPLSQFVKSTGNTHQKAGSRTRPTPSRKGSQHKLKGGQLNHPSCAYPPVGDPVEHQAFLSAPAKRQARRARQQDRAAAANFGMPQDLQLHESGQPADFKPQPGDGIDFTTPDTSQSPFGSPYTPPFELSSPYTPLHPPWHLPPPLQAPAGFAPPYNWNEEEGTQPGHETLDEQGLANQHGPQPQAPETMIANYDGTSNSALPFSPAFPPSFSAHAGEDSQMSHYGQYHASGPSIRKSAGSAGKKRKSAGLYQNGPEGRYQNSPAPQPAYAPSNPRAYAPPSSCTYAPSSPRAHTPSSFSDYSPYSLPTDFTKHGGDASAGNHLQAVGLGSQGSPQADPGNHLEQGGTGVSEKRLQWALSRLASLESRVLRLEASAATC